MGCVRSKRANDRPFLETVRAHSPSFENLWLRGPYAIQTPTLTLSGKISALTLSCISFTKYSTLYETQRAIAAFASPQAKAPPGPTTGERQTPGAASSASAVCSRTAHPRTVAGAQRHSAATYRASSRGRAAGPYRWQAQARVSHLSVFAAIEPCPSDLRGKSSRGTVPGHAGLLYSVC